MYCILPMSAVLREKSTSDLDLVHISPFSAATAISNEGISVRHRRIPANSFVLKKRSFPLVQLICSQSAITLASRHTSESCLHRGQLYTRIADLERKENYSPAHVCRLCNVKTDYRHWSIFTMPSKSYFSTFKVCMLIFSCTFLIVWVCLQIVSRRIFVRSNYN